MNSQADAAGQEQLSEAELSALNALAADDPTHYNEEAARDRWSALSREGDPQTREDIEKRLVELDAEDAAEDDVVMNSKGKVHESGTPCKATKKPCPLAHKKNGEETEKKSSWDTGTFTKAQKQQAIADFAKVRKAKTTELREKISGSIESPIPGIPSVKVTGSSIKEMLNNKAIWSSMALGASVDVHIEAAEKTREYVKTATPGKPVPTTDPTDPIKEKIYLDKQFTAKDGNTYTARYMVRVFKQSGMDPDIYFMNCRK